MMARASAPLDVYLNDRMVGQLRRESSGATDFRYDDAWLAWENAIPVSLSLPLREDRYIGAPVLAVFENLLPDSDAIRRALAERSGAEGEDAYSLLAAVGRDCVGALQFLPEGTGLGKSGRIRARAISDKEIAAMVRNLARNPLGVGDDKEFRISLAGAQEKTALLYWQNKWHLPHGTTPTTHVIKPQIGKNDDGMDFSQSVENEHLCMQLVAAFGLPVAKTRIIDFEDRRVLAVERFDRLWTRDKRLLRLPQEDCCQALSIPPARKYENQGGPGIQTIMELLKGSDTPEHDQRTFFKAQIAFWLLGAIDGHAKNFSLRLSPGGRFVMAPLYDIISAQPVLDAGQIRQNQLKMSMAIGDSRHYVIGTILGRHFIESARTSGLAERAVRNVIDEVIATVPAAIDRTLSGLPQGFPYKLASSIAEAARKRLTSLALTNKI